MEPVLEQRFVLADLLDPSVLKEVIQAASACFNLGIAIFDENGQEMMSFCPKYSFCQAIKDANLDSKCGDVLKRVFRQDLDEARMLQFKSFCGMKYALFPLRYQLDIVGRALVGPFRDPETGLEKIKEIMGKEQGPVLSEDQVQQVPALNPEKLKNVLRLISKTLDSFLLINAKRMITTKIHLETIYSSRDQIFREMETQQSGTEKDKQEIEKLKNMF